MKTTTRTLIALLSITLMVVGLGCAALSTLVTPGTVDQDALRYAIDAGVAEPNDYDAWYPNLDEATRLKQDVDSAHVLNQQELQHLMEKDTTQHGIHQKVTTTNYQTAVQREEILFGETGLLSMGLGMAGMGGFAGLLGLTRKRPGDITGAEMEQTLAIVNGAAEKDLSVKEKQFVQLVKGVQAFMDNNEDAPNTNVLKRELSMAQDKDTQAAVAVVKKTV